MINRLALRTVRPSMGMAFRQAPYVLSFGDFNLLGLAFTNYIYPELV